MTPAVKSFPSFASAKQGAPAESELLPTQDEWRLHEPVVGIDKRDAGSPDDWIPRHPDLTRLTGRHPFNCEPPLTQLVDHGFITPVSLHYVRNHGPPPRLTWSTHRITIQGLVDAPITISMDDIMKLPAVTIPVTLVCAGNRRKEENMRKKTIGFNWSASGLSTTYWTGVRMSDILKLALISPDAEYVCFNGPEKELPKGQDGSYGTSLLLSYAMSDANDVLVAYKQNGRWLTPDHGFPVRMIIPGFIGGRMVKWLKTIDLTAKESDNYYHYHDNRVLPPHVDDVLAAKEGWWYKPDFIINELNINSAIAKPAHDETVLLDSNRSYTVSGYAYTGGGRKIIRVEVSLDDGKFWNPAEILRFEQPNKHGKYWCWVHWKFEVCTAAMLSSKEILVRAWDSSQNGQPATLTWNVMGMMNNCYYRVKILPHTDANGRFCLRFQHPAPVISGTSGLVGWREEAKADAVASEPAAVIPVDAAVKVPGVDTDTIYTLEEVEEHDDEKSAWFIHESKVYDATPFLNEHPGGADSILLAAGQDATVEFNSIHSSKARAMLAPYLIGKLGTEADKVAQAGASKAANGNAVPNGIIAEIPNGLANGVKAVPLVAANGLANGVKAVPPVAANGLANGVKAVPPVAANGTSLDLVALNPKKKLSLKLQEKTQLNHNTYMFRFALPTPQHRFGLPVGKHVFLYATVNGEQIMRAYTPTSSDEDIGHFDLVVKIYRANEHPRFPDGGMMSQHLEQLPVGNTIDVKGPVGHFIYLKEGNYTSHNHPGFVKVMNFIAGGTGLTPCYAVIKAVLRNPNDKTELRLVYANNSPNDILLREELDELAAKHSNFKVWYTVSAADDDWKYGRGRVTLEMLQEHLLPVQPGASLALMCGPPPMLKYACVPNLEKMGYTSEMMVTF